MTDLVLQMGCDWTRTITYTDSNGTAINLTGYTAKLQVRASTKSCDTIKIIDLSSPSNGIVIDGALGKITITIGHALLTEPTLNLKGITTTEIINESTTLSGNGKIGYYDLFITSPGSIVSKLISGKVCFNPAITRG